MEYASTSNIIKSEKNDEIGEMKRSVVYVVHSIRYECKKYERQDKISMISS